MELKTFVAESIKQIIDGIIEAQEHAKTVKAFVNPPNIVIRDNYIDLSISQKDRKGQFVDFDVAVTLTESDSAEGDVKGQIGIVKLGLGLGADASGKTEQINSQISRIKFSLPIFFPEQ